MRNFFSLEYGPPGYGQPVSVALFPLIMVFEAILNARIFTGVLSLIKTNPHLNFLLFHKKKVRRSDDLRTNGGNRGCVFNKYSNSEPKSREKKQFYVFFIQL